MTAKKVLGIVVNPTSGRGNALVNGALVFEYLSERAKELGYEVRDFTSATYEDALSSIKKSISDKELSVLIVIGGDGMIHLGFNAVAGTNVLLGIIPCGSGNDYIRSLHIPTNEPLLVAKGICRGLKENTVLPVDAGFIECKEGNQWFAGSLSAGIDARINDRANKMSLRFGTARYMNASLAEIALLSKNKFDYKISIEGCEVKHLGDTEPDYKALMNANSEFAKAKPKGLKKYSIEDDGILVIASNAPYIGGGIKIAPQSYVNSGSLEFIWAPDYKNTGKEVKIFQSAYKGNHIKNEKMRAFLTRKVTIEHKTEREDSHIICADGEKLGTLPVKVTLQPNAVKLVLHPNAYQRFLAQKELAETVFEDAQNENDIQNKINDLFDSAGATATKLGENVAFAVAKVGEGANEVAKKVEEIRKSIDDDKIDNEIVKKIVNVPSAVASVPGNFNKKIKEPITKAIRKYKKDREVRRVKRRLKNEVDKKKKQFKKIVKNNK